MKFTVTLDQIPHEVVVEEEFGRRKLSVDGNALNLDLVKQDGSRLCFVLNHRPVQALITGKAPELSIDSGAGPKPVTVEETRFADVRKISGHATRPSAAPKLVAPMPGLITKVMVSVGDQVKAGTPLLLMEAMKMENELRASGAGKVKAIHAHPGEAVELGAVLVAFDMPEPAG